MILRDAIPADAKSICRIWNDAIRDSTATFTSEEKSTAKMSEQIENARIFLVAEHGPEVLGFCTMSAFRAGSGYAGCGELTLYVEEGARGNGVGASLLSALETRAKILNIHSLVGAISGTNGPALAFHLAKDFKEVGRMPKIARKFGQKLDLVLMLKKL